MKMPRFPLGAGLAAVLLLAGTQAAPAADLGSATQAWKAQHYQDAYTMLAEIRAQPYGRRPLVDFMLGTSGCRLDPDARNYGHRLLDWMLYAYALSQPSRELVTHERDLCRQLELALSGVEPGNIEETRSAGMRGFGKTFYWAGQEQTVSSYPMRRVKKIVLAELERRRVPLGDEVAALALAKRLAPGMRYRIQDRFILIGTLRHTDDQLRQVGQTLNRFVRFLENEYGVVLPEHYLRVHLMGDTHEVKQLALDLHGMDVSPATIGYAFVEDSTVVGYVPEAAAGTLLHELFHMLVRSNFGDIPQWLDEGIASLYEVSGRRGDHYYGLDNWRRRVLDDVWHLRPSIAQLVRSEWFLFDDPRQVRAFEQDAKHEGYHDRQEGAKQAAMMATARYFALYLEQRNKLAAVYRTVREEGLDDAISAPRDRVVALVEQTLGQPLTDVDADFVAWYRSGDTSARQVSQEGGPLLAATANVSVRNGPGIRHTRLMVITAGTLVAEQGRRDGWVEVRLSDGIEAYISADYLEPAERIDKPLPE